MFLCCGGLDSIAQNSEKFVGEVPFVKLLFDAVSGVDCALNGSNQLWTKIQ